MSFWNKFKATKIHWAAFNPLIPSSVLIFEGNRRKQKMLQVGDLKYAPGALDVDVRRETGNTVTFVAFPLDYEPEKGQPWDLDKIVDGEDIVLNLPPEIMATMITQGKTPDGIPVATLYEFAKAQPEFEGHKPNEV